jgi:hypothetical protein
MTDPGILAIAFFEASAGLILLVIYFFLHRNLRRRFFRYWLAGWALFTVYGLIALYFHWRGGGETVRLLALESCFAAFFLFLVSGRRRWPASL